MACAYLKYFLTKTSSSGNCYILVLSKNMVIPFGIEISFTI